MAGYLAQCSQGIPRLPHGIRWCRVYHRRPDAHWDTGVERKQLYEQRSSILGEQEKVKKIMRQDSLQRWQEKWNATVERSWTHRLIPQVDNWVNRKHGEVNYYLTHKESPYPPGNGFSRALESLFLLPKNEAQCSQFHSMGPFSWDMGNLITNFLYIVKKWWLFYWLSHCKYLRYKNEEEKL